MTAKLIPYVGSDLTDYHARFGRIKAVHVPVDRARDLMRDGMNTKQIASLLGSTEAAVWNALCAADRVRA